jgi:hypothetical protein
MDFMFDHWALSILATIVLGAIGSGFWEIALKPASVKILQVLFTIITFGTKRASNRLYREAARGHHELASIILFCAVFAGVFGFLVTMETKVYATLNTPLPHSVLDIVEKTDTVETAECANEKDEAAQRMCELESEREQNVKKLVSLLEDRESYKSKLNYMILMSIFIGVIIFYQIIYIMAANSIITQYKQWFKSCSPYLSSDERLIIEQKFALMASKEACDAIMTDLKKLAEKN